MEADTRKHEIYKHDDKIEYRLALAATPHGIHAVAVQRNGQPQFNGPDTEYHGQVPETLMKLFTGLTRPLS